MAGKFMRIKKVIIPMITLIIIASQLAGCAVMESKEMIGMIDSGQSITIELPAPSYKIEIKGQQQEQHAWTQLDQLKTHNNGFRQDFDTLFNINTVTENTINGKSGCLYVDEANDRNGNTTLEDALRNKVFVNKYWAGSAVKDKLAALAEEAYTDVDKNSESAIMASLNAYYNLLPDYVNPDSFNGTKSLTREEFYTLVFKSEEGVRPIEGDASFEQAIGGQTELSKYAQGVDQYGFLSAGNKSLDATSYKGSISRAEAVYMIVNKHFPNELAKVTGKEQAFKDTKNAGDLALKVGFKEKKDGEIISKDRWQAYTLAYMAQHPDKGLQEELYKAMVVAKQLNLISGSESRWDEPISKAEAIQLVVNTHLAKNSLYGYLSEVEYGKMNPNKFNVSSENAFEVKGVDDEGFAYGKDWTEVPESIVPADPNKKLNNGVTLGEVKKLIDLQKEQLKGKGYSDSEMNELLGQLAKEFGSSLEEINRLPDTKKPAPVVQQPAQKDEKPAQEVPSNNNSGNTSGNSGSNVSSGTLELKGDKWHTKEEKEAAMQRAIQNGDTDFERRAKEWEAMPDWAKDSMVSPYDEGYVPDLQGVQNPFK